MLANDTEYGLAAYFYTRDLRRAWHIAEQLEYGMVRHTASHFITPASAAGPAVLSQMEFAAIPLCVAPALRAS